MGKQWPRAGSWQVQQDAHSDSSSALSYWPGTWKPPRGQNKWQKDQGTQGQAGAEKDRQKFPAYKQMNVANVKDKEHVNGNGGTNTDQGPLQPRRLDARMRKNIGEREEADRKWDEFQERLRNTFVEQRQLDTKKLGHDLEDLRTQKQEAIVQDLVEHQGRGQASRAKEVLPTDEDVRAWNDLMEQAPRRQPMEMEEDDVLRQALRLQAIQMGS